MDAVGTGIGVLATGDDCQEVGFTEGNLLNSVLARIVAKIRLRMGSGRGAALRPRSLLRLLESGFEGLESVL